MRHLHLRQSAELLEAILRGSLPADAQMERYFRAHREMGVRDRGTVAECVYGCLREKRLLEHLAGSAAPADILAAYWLRQGLSGRALAAAGYPEEKARALAARVRTVDERTLPFALRRSLPDWLAERLLAQYGAEQAEALAQALNRPAPVDLRANTLKTDRETLRQRLAAEGFACEPTPYSPFGLRREERTPLFRTRAFREGLFEVQDEGSQLVSLLLEPRRHEMIADFCAGAGGKTLALAALAANTSTVYAFDVSAARLARLKPRLVRAGLDNVRIVALAHERDERLRRLAGKLDRVLVDVPCSGTGTLRRSPDLKWRPIDLAALTAAQARILAAAATLVKPGGRLVYVTCSVLAEENEAIVESFRAAHPEFVLIPAAEILARRHIPLVPEDAYLRLLPHRHGTDGFFAAVLAYRR
jgi:16S rRNA (cytosine967-C5)-methyltransferase